MGATKEQKDTSNRKPRKYRRRTKTEADWSKLNAEVAYHLILTVARFNGAVRFGRSRDGNQYAIGVYGDGDPWTEYLEGASDCNEWLISIVEDLNDAG